MKLRTNLTVAIILLLAIFVYAKNVQVYDSRISSETFISLDNSDYKIDGNLSNKELKDAQKQEMAGGGNAFYKIIDSKLYVGVRGLKPGISHICVTDGKDIYVFHASAALGTAVFKQKDGKWQLTQKFKWELRDITMTPEAETTRKNFYKKNGWVASVGGMGKSTEMEYIISSKFTQGDKFKFVAVYASDPKSISFYPQKITDDTKFVKLISGDPPVTLKFEPKTWSVISTSPKSKKANKDKSISVKASVDPGAELITIMLWMSGKYPLPMDSSYKSKVWKHFSKYRNHNSLERMRKAKMYPDFTENGLLLSNFPDVKVEIPKTNSWYKVTGKDEVIGILNDAKTFAKISKFWKFYQKNKNSYEDISETFTKQLREKKVLSKVDVFFGYKDNRTKPNVTIYLEPLNYWGAHAIDFERLRGETDTNEVAFQMGPSRQRKQFPDSELKFNLNQYNTRTVWHESSHIYLKKTLTENKNEIAKLTRLFNEKDLASQNIKTWEYAFEENLVRAIVAVITKQEMGREEYKREIASQKRRGFIYVEKIAEKIQKDYVNKKDSYENFEEFMPQILSVLENAVV